MSLLERITRLVEKYRLLPRLIRSLSYLSFVLALLGTGLIFVLPCYGQYRNTYISENALMPSQAYSFYRESEWNFLRGYRDTLSKMSDLSLHEQNLLILEWLGDLGYKPSVHEFEYLNGTKGENLYAILHTPRADSESMLISAPWTTSSGEWNIGGIALTISLGKYFSRLNIWSKNIILVFPQDSKFASRAWVELYHTSLDNTGGSIESAIVIEYPTENDLLHHIELEYDGLNGQLPNLDLLNCAVSIGEHEGFKVALQKNAQYESNYWNRLKILLLGIKNLAITGIVSNSCETFSGFNIQLLTIRAVGDEGYDITTFGRVVEGIFRSVNNLLEKFHQSFFYYLMLQPRNFVSIGTYLPSAVLLSVSFGIASLNSFLNNSISYADIKPKIQLAFIIFGLILTISISVGILLQSYALQLTEFWARLFVQLNILLSVIPVLLSSRKKLSKISNSQDAKEEAKSDTLVLKYVLQSISYLYMTMILVSLLVVHFTLAFIIGVISIPLLLVKVEYEKASEQKRRVVNFLLLICSSPFTSLLLLSYIDDMPVYEIMVNLLSSWSQLQCWTWFIVIAGWYPTWLCILVSSI